MLCRADNIPGVKGVGPKTAAALLAEFGSIDGIYAALEDLDAALATDSRAHKLLRKVRSNASAARTLRVNRPRSRCWGRSRSCSAKPRSWR